LLKNILINLITVFKKELKLLKKNVTLFYKKKIILTNLERKKKFF
jgi:hypothetical protein